MLRAAAALQWCPERFAETLIPVLLRLTYIRIHVCILQAFCFDSI